MISEPTAHKASDAGSRNNRESRIFRFRAIAALLIGWHILGGLLAILIGKVVLQIFTLMAGAVIAVLFLIGPGSGQEVS